MTERNWNQFFTAEDFSSHGKYYRACEYQRHTTKSPGAAYGALAALCSEIANAILAEELKKAKRVYLDAEVGRKSDYWTDRRQAVNWPTHTALLIDEKEMSE